MLPNTPYPVLDSTSNSSPPSFLGPSLPSQNTANSSFSSLSNQTLFRANSVHCSQFRLPNFQNSEPSRSSDSTEDRLALQFCGGNMAGREGCCWIFKVVILFVCVVSVSGVRVLKVKHIDAKHIPHYNHTLATILVEYASAVYMSDLTELFTWTCSRCDGMTKGFEIIELIVDVQHCLQAFVGVAEDLNAIVIAFRGTQEHSIQNWIEDLYWKQLDIKYPGMSPDAMVHHGFYFAYHNTTIRSGILHAVKRAKELYGDIDVMVTGHSMGGAMASFCGLDLKVHDETQNVFVMTFGQPRIGNAAFAECYSNLVPNTIRVTNEHDIVPHLPPYYTYFPQKTYHHFPREVWLYNIGMGSLVYPVEKVCDSSGEDPSCSRSVAGNSISDHLTYYGVQLNAETWESCSIVMDPRIQAYGTRDLNGNLMLLKDPAASALKLKTRAGDGAKYA